MNITFEGSLILMFTKIKMHNNKLISTIAFQFPETLMRCAKNAFF